MKIAICDDDKMFLLYLKSKLETFEFFKAAEISTFNNGDELLEAFYKEEFDFVFTDVEIPGVNGIEVGKKINAQKPRTVIVFVSNYSQYAVDAFECDAVSYLLKNADERKLTETVQKAIKKYTRFNYNIRLDVSSGIVNLRPDEIIYVEYFRKYCIYHTASEEYSVRQTLQSALKELNHLGFYQVYRCYLVNLAKIREIRSKEVILDMGTALNISRGTYNDIIAAYAAFVEGMV